MKRQTFFQKLTGAINADDEFMFDDDNSKSTKPNLLREDKVEEAELAVDVSQTPSEIIIKTMVAGVSPDDVDVSISQEMVTIKGARREMFETQEHDYFHRELYWGAFSRTILLPSEVKPDEAAAEIRHGLLTIRLPKIDKQKQTKVKIRTV